MKLQKMIKIAAATMMLGLAATSAKAVPTTLVSAGESYQYAQLTVDLWPSWATSSLADFSSNNGNWQSGNAAFSNVGGSTYWAASTDLALQKTFNFSGAVNGNLNLHVASDNGFLVYLNGQLLAKDNAEGFTSYWEYNYSLSPAALLQGSNLLQILAEDHGGATFFDLQLDADVTDVPAPAPLALLGIGLIGLIAGRRKKQH